MFFDRKRLVTVVRPRNQQGGFLPEHRRRYPVAIPLYPSPPSGWVWDLLNFQIKGKLSAPFRIRAVPGKQPMRGADGVKTAVLRKGLAKLTLIRAAAHAHVMVENQNE